MLSGATRNGVTYTYDSAYERSGTTGGTAIQEAITPSYNTSFPDMIFAVRPADGATGVSGCRWVDINLDGRYWAEKD